jgi:hypothetical protein
MPDLTLSDRIVIPDSVVFRDLGGETVVLNLETGLYFGLDEVGTEVWNDLRNGSTLQQTFDRLIGEYDVAADTLRADILRFVNHMAAKGLVQQAR